MRGTSLGLSLLAVATLLLGPASAYALGDECKADIDKLCLEEKRGHGLIVDCLLAHESELSADCQSVVAPVEPKKQPAEPVIAPAEPGFSGPPPALGVRALLACRSDLTEHCKGTGHEREKLRACLDGHTTELSDLCKRALAADDKQRKEYEARAAREKRDRDAANKAGKPGDATDAVKKSEVAKPVKPADAVDKAAAPTEPSVNPEPGESAAPGDGSP